EAALRRSEARYRELFENSPYGMFCSTPDGTLLDANPALITMLGYSSKEELLSRNLIRDICEEPNAQAGLRDRLLQQGRAEAAEVKWRRKDGKVITVRISGREIQGEDASVNQMEAIAEDITDRKLLEDQFRQAQKMEAVGQLAGGVAHDFNNLLTIINGYSDLLLIKLQKDDPERNLVEQIREAGWRSAALTRQLLMFSRKQITAPRHIDLSAVVTGVEKMLERIIGEDIALRTYPCPEPCVVQADPARIEQMVMNLAVNARDAMPQGGELILRTDRVELDETSAQRHVGIRPGCYVALTVSDTGNGMTEEVMNHLFEPFFTTKGPEKGTGLGLAVVHGIVKDSEGHIEVESQAGQGTTFRVYLPEGEKSDAPDAAPPASEGASPRGAETILLVEDNHALRALTSDILRSHGYFVLEAVDGVNGIRLAQGYQDRIDLLATDIVMPGLGGRQLAEQLSAVHPETKVLYLSGHTDDAVARHGVVQDAVQFLEKPFAPEVLALKIRGVLDSE
ncbi:MAG TPA: ATP-binding protein, partial [Bryobacteraceae bacterium]|nr:ATP-binding protein [Bryobacteraceae bacterium]